MTSETIASGAVGRLSSRYVATLGHTVGLASRCVLTPVGHNLMAPPVGA